jgi:ribosomal-protein-alanine N-acetyltransferase
MVLRASGFVLRPFRASDAASLASHANNFNIARHLRDRFPHPYSLQDARDFIAAVAQDAGASTSVAIDVAGEAVGAIGYVPGHDVER